MVRTRDEAHGVEKGDPAGIAAAVERILGDRALRERMGRAAEERAQRHFDWSNIATALRELYVAGIARLTPA